MLAMNARFSGEKRGVDRHQVYVWVHSATHPAETDLCLGSRCDTPRPTATPLREGMGCRITLIINGALPRHPLSERGGRRPGCVAPSNTDNPGCVALSNWDIRWIRSIRGPLIGVATLKILRKSFSKLFKFVLSVGRCLDSQRGGDDGMIRTSRQKINIILFKTQ